MGIVWKPTKRICKSCGKKYLRTGRYQTLCKKCKRRIWKVAHKGKKFVPITTIVKKNKQMLRALLL